eukprot:CAMPEP_0176430758 /NCGR_PEP_ID=MMETSP0127-20121128/14430_1 /TAXON_ID=938130 /ORGANISM="Platyophrya macrostoma, Strain WH" /LENGTH=455 /DNA_ID=CAMNT_0017812681 /DNA_START=147 /DNA_END=1515 /DNA_ORIENTATION=+
MAYDVIVRVLTLAGKYVKDESINNLIHLIAATPELYTYCVHKMYYSITENIDQDGLVKVGLWCIGEHGMDLINGKAKGPDGKSLIIPEAEVIGLIEKAITRVNVPESIKEFALNCLIKLYPNYKNARDQIKMLIDSQTTSSQLEVQQRACEYLQLLEKDWDNVRGGDKEIDELPPQVMDSKGSKQLVATHNVDVRKETAVQDLLDLDSLEPDQLDNKSGTTTTTGSGTPSSNLYELDFGGKPSGSNIMDLYGGGGNLGGQIGGNMGGQMGNQMGGINFMNTGMSTGPNLLEGLSFGGSTQVQGGQPISNVKPSSGFDLLDNLDDFSSLQGSTSTQNSKALTLNVIDDGSITVIFNCAKESEDTTNINTTFDNNSSTPITELVFQVAVQKHLKLTLNPLSGTKINPNTKAGVTQSMKIQNSKQGEKPVVLKLKLTYKLGMNTVTRDATVNQFPQDY